MPVVQPAELWQESGRLAKYGPELLRLKDRHERDFVVQPTSEEVITDIARKDLQQLQAAADQFLSHPDQVPRRDPAALRRDALARVRDEGRVFVRRRPGRQCYGPTRRCTTRTRGSSRGWGSRSAPSPPTPGQIGGSASHEFQVLADSGEDAIAWCPGVGLCGQRRTRRGDRAGAVARAPRRADAEGPDAGQETCEDVALLLGLPLTRTVKCIMLATDSEGAPSRIWMLLIRGDHALNEVKIEQGAGAREVSLGKRSRDRRRDRLPARLSRSGRHFQGDPARRRSLGRGDGGLRLRRQRAGLPPDRRQLRPRLPRARHGRRHPQRRRGRPLARRQGHARDPARHRGRPRLRARHPVLEGHECNLSRRQGSSRS